MNETELLEQRLLLEGIYQKYGYDFRRYAESSLIRRLQHILLQYSVSDLLDLLKLILKDEKFFRQILPQLTVPTTELFRDPEVFAFVRERIVPFLRTYPSLSIWDAGCSTGEESYSLAILLQEEGLLERTTIYATDINPLALKKAKAGCYELASLRPFAKNYILSGGLASPLDYYVLEGGQARMNSILKEHIVFSEHNLATDQDFKEMHLILCRNVLIYFNKSLQDRALQLFYDSLVHRGFLLLGSKETIRFSPLSSLFRVFDGDHRVYQRLERLYET